MRLPLERGEIVLLYDVVGEGTRAMSEMAPGEKNSTSLNGLGNGFTTNSGANRPLLLGGGIGCAPLLGLARALKTKRAWSLWQFSDTTQRQILSAWISGLKKSAWRHTLPL